MSWLALLLFCVVMPILIVWFGTQWREAVSEANRWGQSYDALKADRDRLERENAVLRKQVAEVRRIVGPGGDA